MMEILHTDGIQTTSPVSVILDGFTLQTVSNSKDLLMKNSIFSFDNSG